jgi:hypothetical protein
MPVLADQDELPFGIHRNNGYAGTMVNPALFADPTVRQSDVAFKNIENTTMIDMVTVWFINFSHVGAAFLFNWFS